MTRRVSDPAIAQPEEVLRVMTSILRGEQPEDAAVKTSERYKAAELLGRHYGLFERPEAAPPDTRRLSREITQLLAEIAEEAHSGEGAKVCKRAPNARKTPQCGVFSEAKAAATGSQSPLPAPAGAEPLLLYHIALGFAHTDA